MAAVNCSIILEEDLFYTYEDTGCLHEVFIEDRLTFSCQHSESLFSWDLINQAFENLDNSDWSHESESELNEDELELLANLQNLLENGIDE